MQGDSQSYAYDHHVHKTLERGSWGDYTTTVAPAYKIALKKGLGYACIENGMLLVRICPETGNKMNVTEKNDVSWKNNYTNLRGDDFYPA